MSEEEQAKMKVQPPAESEPRLDEINLNIKTSDEAEYGINATLLDGDVEIITLTDREGDQTIFPALVLRQLMAGISMQESLIRETVMQAQMRQGAQVAGFQQFPARRQLGQLGQY